MLSECPSPVNGEEPCFVKQQRKPHVFFCLLFQNRATFVLRKSVARFLVLSPVKLEARAGVEPTYTDLQSGA